MLLRIKVCQATVQRTVGSKASAEDP